jgi:hypothetical protein
MPPDVDGLAGRGNRDLSSLSTGTKRRKAQMPRQLKGPVYVTQQYAVSQGQESAVVISMREYQRIIERLDGCKPIGWADMWLAGFGAGAGLVIGAFVGALTLPNSLPGIRDVLWALTATGVVIVVLCLAAYHSQRRVRGEEIGELQKDLQIHLNRATPT